MSTPNRTRTFSWQDPTPSLKRSLSMSGLDYMQALIDGELPPPPIAETLDFRLLEVSPGRAVFGVQPAESHYNPIGSVHGGLAATLLDSAMGCAVHTLLPEGKGYTTLQINVNFVRAIQVDTGFLRCEAEAIHAGRRTATAEGRLLDGDGQVYAHATTTCLVFEIG